MIDFSIKFESLASGSTGNCYLVSGHETKILIEAGIPVNKISEKLSHKLYDVDACIVSHSHLDHNKSIFDVAAKGIQVHALKETFEKFPKHHNFNSLKCKTVNGNVAYQAIKVGEFTIYPFEVDHDVPNVGYLISSNLSGEKLLFVIDTYYVPYKFTGITHYCMEANYSAEILKKMVDSNSIAKVYADRIYKSHFSLESLVDFFAANDTSMCKEINLMHMSNTNGNAEMFKKTIEDVTGKVVNVCAVGGGYV